MQRAKSEYSIQTVVNALRVLEAFETSEKLGVTDLAHRLELHKNNVFRILATLEESGWVEQTEDETYRLGASCVRLSHAYARSRSLTRLARASLECLCRDTCETAHLGVLRDYEVVHLDGELSSAPVVGSLRIGDRIPAHCTALGKVLLACGPKATLEAYDRDVVARGGVAWRTHGTLVDREKLFEHLRRVAAQGYAIDHEEFVPGVACTAAPVYDADGRLVAALSISGPSFRMTPDAIENALAPRVVAEATALSRRLGFSM
jgi:IclR family KDG regulon transcriptional repressor